MTLSHDALFRPPGPAGFDLHPHFPFTGPYLFYDTRDHDHGPTGYTARSAGVPGFANTTGSLPNTGFAGSTFDLAVFQEDRWIPADFGLPDHARYEVEAYLDNTDLGHVAPFAYIDSLTGGPPSNGPYVWISVMGNVLDTRLRIPTTGWPPTGDDAARFSMQVTFPNATVWTARFDHRVGFDTFGGNHVGFADDSFFPGVDSTGALAGDVIPTTDVRLAPSANAFMVESMHVNMIDVAAGLVDYNAFDVWITDDDRLGLSPSDIEDVTHQWWGLGDNPDPTSWRQEAREFDPNMATQALVDHAYRGTGVTFWSIGADSERRFDTGDGSAVPVEGQPWLAWRGWGLWRGNPTAADLAAIRADFGV